MVKGTVVNFRARNGFGFIQPEGTEGKDAQVFAHWKQIKTKAKWPTLEEGQVVQYDLEDIKGKEQAANICLPGGKPIKASNKIHEGKKYGKKKVTGTVKFFDNRKGFGFITPEDEDLELNGNTLEDGDGKKGVYFQREDITAAGEGDARVDDDTEVAFVLYTREEKEGLCAGKITLPDGKAIEYIPKEYTEEELAEFKAKREEKQAEAKKKKGSGKKKGKKRKQKWTKAERKEWNEQQKAKKAKKN